LSKLDFSLVKAFVGDTMQYDHAFFKMRVFNNNNHVVRLYIEKYVSPFVAQKMPGQEKSGSIFMLDSNRNKSGELLLWPTYRNEIIINPKKSFEFLLRASTKGLVRSDEQKKAPGFQRMLSDRIRNTLYYYYGLNDKGIIEDSFAIQPDKNFFIAYREPLVED
jgi:hypothetical protein